MKLNSLHIEYFRGATKPFTLHFSQGKNITLMYGENGNGKSTIADALVCLCTDGLGSLDDKSAADENYLKSLGNKNSDVLIQLTTDTKTYKATLSTSSNKIIKDPNKDLPKLKALRRAQVTSFIDDTPSERYKVLSYFIDVSNIQKSETELKRLINTLQTDLEQNVKSLSDANQTLQNIWNNAGKPFDNFETWLEAELAKDNAKSQSEYSQNKNVLQVWFSFQTVVESIQAENIKYKKAKEIFDAAETKLNDYKNANSNSESDLLSVLSETKKFLSGKESIDKCPVCGKTNDKATLLQHVSAHIGKMEELSKLTQACKSAKLEKEKLYQRLEGQIEPFNKGINKFKNESIKLSGYNFATILYEISEAKSTKENYKAFSLIYDQAKEEIKKLNTANDVIGKSLSFSNSIKSNHQSIGQLTKKCEQLEILVNQAKPTLEILETTRKEFIDNELASISGDVEAMYKMIHPNEGLGNVKLFLNRNFQSSLSLTADFHSVADITPQSVYSESHLDTLGICIFIALAKKESNQDLILILDDVVMSVDERHLDRIIDLIHDQAQYFGHVIISTHYRPWRERYRNHRAPSTKVQFVELRGWTRERGITQAKPNLVLDEIKYYLAAPENFHRENLAGTTGRFLEALLDFLTFNFQCRLKRKPANDYTLSELLDGLSKDLLKLLRIQKMEWLPTDKKYSATSFTEEVVLKSIIDDIKNLKAVRNQVGAHFTFDGALVSDSDIEDFAKATIKLAELLVCPVDGNLPDRKPSGSFWETKSGSIRLYPLIEP